MSKLYPFEGNGSYPGSCLFLGFGIALLIFTLPMANQPEVNIGLSLLCAIFLLFSRLPDRIRDLGPKDNNSPNWIKYSFLILILLTLTVEFSYFFWSLALRNTVETVWNNGSLAATAILIFVGTYKLGPLLSQYKSLGLLFTMSCLLTLSIGLFYTFDLPFIFVITFSASLISIPIWIRLYFKDHIEWHILASMLISVAILQWIIGYFIEINFYFWRVSKCQRKCNCCH